MTNVVISQSMLFPWVGMLEQMLLADVFIHYNDVQFSKEVLQIGCNLRQSGSLWMTVPLMDHKFGQAINEVKVQPSENGFRSIFFFRAEFCRCALRVRSNQFGK